MIVGPCRVVTGGAEPRVLEDAGVLVSGAHIAQVGPVAGLAAAHPDETVWPAGGRLLLPGRVNAHAHLARHLARGLAIAGAPGWDRYDAALSPEDVYWSALAALIEGVRHGVTTVFDLHRSGGCLDLSLSEIAAAAARLGVRVATGYAVAEEDGPAERRAALEESLGLAADLERRRQGRVRALVGVRASTLEGLATLIAECRDRAGDRALHVELALDATPAARWTAPPAGLASPPLWAHAERAPRALWNAARERGDALSVIGPCVGALARDGGLAWGSDTGLNAPPLPESASGSAFRPAQPEVAEAYCRRVYHNGARWAASLFGDALGMIEAGSPADLVVVDYHPATELESRTLACHLATGVARASVSGVMVAGEILMDHGVVVGLDEAEVAARARECARRLWSRLG